jgi:hypothetical protein
MSKPNKSNNVGNNVGHVKSIKGTSSALNCQVGQGGTGPAFRARTAAPGLAKPADAPVAVPMPK